MCFVGFQQNLKIITWNKHFRTGNITGNLNCFNKKIIPSILFVLVQNLQN